MVRRKKKSYITLLFDRCSSLRKSSEAATGGVLTNVAKFIGKHLCHSLFFNKVAGLRSATLLKKRLWHRCFPVNFAKFLRKPFLQNTSRRLLLKVVNLLFYFRVFVSEKRKCTLNITTKPKDLVYNF